MQEIGSMMTEKMDRVQLLVGRVQRIEHQVMCRCLAACRFYLQIRLSNGAWLVNSYSQIWVKSMP